MAMRRLHQFNQHPAHVARVEEDDGRAMRADARLAQQRGTLGLKFGDGGGHVGDLETEMMLPARRVLLQEIGNGGGFV